MLESQGRFCAREIVRFVSLRGRPYSSMVHFSINPRVALVDERVSIKVNSLLPLQRVTVQAWVEEGKAVFSSCGHFQADKQGVVDIARHASLGGTYTGVDSMGLFWSLKPIPGISKDPLLRKVDVTTPLVFGLSVIDGHIPWNDLQLPTTVVLVTGSLQRWYKHGAVSRIEVREGSIRGTFFLPVGKGRFPGVLDMFGSTGGLTEFRAALLASRGFATFALAYLKYDDLPTKMADIDFDYFLVKALVNIGGAPLYGPADLKKCGEVFWKGFKFIESKLIHTDEGVYLKDASCYGTEIIPAWTNNAKILYLCGEDDGVWRTDFAYKFVETCPEGKRKNIELIIYPGAGHLIEPPYMPVSRAMFHKVFGFTLVMGGQPEAHAAAQEDAWQRILHFLNTHLPKDHNRMSPL